MLEMTSTGSGLPIVFLHAFPLSGRMWEPNTPELSKHFRVITLDFPGFGKSESAGDIATMDHMAESVKKKLGSSGLKEKKVFVGLSMGGYVLMRLLKIMPDQIRAAVFVSTRAAADSPEAKANRFKNIEIIEKEGMPAFVEKQLLTLLGKTALASAPKVVDFVRQLALSAPAPAVCAALRGMAGRPDSTDILKQADFPMLFVSGQEDRAVPSAEMELLSTLRSKSEFRLIEQAGHLLNLEQPAKFNDALVTFLKRKVL
jgi:pimeloyl-ACP methyl ester carboxylesterase